MIDLRMYTSFYLLLRIKSLLVVGVGRTKTTLRARCLPLLTFRYSMNGGWYFWTILVKSASFWIHPTPHLRSRHPKVAIVALTLTMATSGLPPVKLQTVPGLNMEAHSLWQFCPNIHQCLQNVVRLRQFNVKWRFHLSPRGPQKSRDYRGFFIHNN